MSVHRDASRNPVTATAAELLLEQQQRLCQATNRLFGWLMLGQWVFAIGVALWISPFTWVGTSRATHPHVWTAIFLGGLITSLPMALAFRKTKATSTRYVIATAQMLMSGLLIHLSGGRIESHFHVFGSLACLASYRDWRVLLVASAVTTADHYLRGMYWPQSVYGTLNPSVMRSLEHFGWVMFEIIFLIIASLRSQDEMRGIANREAQLLSAYADVERQVNERTVALSYAKGMAEAANRAKSDFLANMSHEIRTPMTAIVGYAEILVNDASVVDDPGQRVSALQTIQRNGNHLLQIINDILDLSKIEAGKLAVESIDCSPQAIVEDVLSLMRVRSHGKGLLLKATYETAVPVKMRSDPTRMRQILVNLVENAIKFTEIGSVELFIRLMTGASPKLEIDVVDTGVGMSPTQQQRLFQPFSQADSSTTRKFGGTGLGLTISRKFAELMGGDLCIAATTKGVGTRFRLTLSTGPLDGVETVMPNHWAATESADPRCSPTMPPAKVLAGYRLLLAEDGPDNQRLISFILKRVGAEVVVVENGKLAVEAAQLANEQQQPFHVILMDMQMPVMDGYVAAARLRAENYAGSIVALTANAMSSDRSKCLAAGCDAYATKPIDRRQLIALIASQIARKPVAVTE